MQPQRSHNLLGLIIATQLNLQFGGNNPDIWLENQEVDITNRGIFFIVIGFVDSKPYYNNRQYDVIPDPMNPLATVLQETLSTGVIEKWRLTICSKDLSALYRKEEVLFALRSTFALQTMEANGLKIASIPSMFLNLSGLDGGSIISKFLIEIEIFTGYNAKQPVDYYDIPPIITQIVQ